MLEAKFEMIKIMKENNGEVRNNAHVAIRVYYEKASDYNVENNPDIESLVINDDQCTIKIYLKDKTSDEYQYIYFQDYDFLY